MTTLDKKNNKHLLKLKILLNHLPIESDEEVELYERIVSILKDYTDQKVLEARIDEHNFVAWSPNEVRHIEIQADRLANLEAQLKAPPQERKE